MIENSSPIQDVGTNKKIYSKTFIWMFLGLLATAIVSVFTYFSGFTENFIGIWPVLAIVEVVVVIVFSLLIRKLPSYVIAVLFFIYAIINGITLSTIFAVFQLSSIIIVFFAASAIFGLSALYGYITNNDLSKLGTIFIITLIVGVVVSIINLFLRNSMLDIVLDWVILLVFFGVTAWDMQKVKMLANSEEGKDDRMAIYCAMDLYLDFINIFIRILSIFGNRRD